MEYHLTPEILFLIEITKFRQEDCQESKCYEIDSGDINWRDFISLASDNKVMALAYSSIKEKEGVYVPKFVVDSFKRLKFWNLARNISTSKLVCNTIELLRIHSIKSVPFKGPVMAHVVYGDISSRYFCDLDLLISEKDVALSYLLFCDNGYVPELSLSPSQMRKYLKTVHSLTFKSPCDRYIIELHWELSAWYLTVPLGLERIEHELELIDFEGYQVFNFNRELSLLYLCVHGNKHNWDSLEQVTCLSWIIEKNRNLDWELLLVRSKELHCYKMVLLGLHLAAELYGVHLPDFVRDAMMKEKKLHQITAKIIESNFIDFHDGSNKKSAGRYSTVHLAVRDNFSDKFCYLLHLLLSPTLADWKKVALPGFLSWGHYVLRLPRLAVEWIMAAVKI